MIGLDAFSCEHVELYSIEQLDNGPNVAGHEHVVRKLLISARNLCTHYIDETSLTAFNILPSKLQYEESLHALRAENKADALDAESLHAFPFQYVVFHVEQVRRIFPVHPISRCYCHQATKQPCAGHRRFARSFSPIENKIKLDNICTI